MFMYTIHTHIKGSVEGTKINLFYYILLQIILLKKTLSLNLLDSPIIFRY